MRKSCKGCTHYRQWMYRGDEFACHYILDTGYSRKCAADCCDKYTKIPLGEIEEQYKDVVRYY